MISGPYFARVLKIGIGAFEGFFGLFWWFLAFRGCFCLFLGGVKGVWAVPRSH